MLVSIKKLFNTHSATSSTKTKTKNIVHYNSSIIKRTGLPVLIRVKIQCFQYILKVVEIFKFFLKKNIEVLKKKKTELRLIRSPHVNKKSMEKFSKTLENIIGAVAISHKLKKETDIFVINVIYFITQYFKYFNYFLKKSTIRVIRLYKQNNFISLVKELKIKKQSMGSNNNIQSKIKLNLLYKLSINNILYLENARIKRIIRKKRYLKPISCGISWEGFKNMFKREKIDFDLDRVYNQEMFDVTTKDIMEGVNDTAEIMEKIKAKYELTPLEEKVFMTVFHFSRRDNTKEFLNMPENVREDFEKYIKTIYKNHPHISDYSWKKTNKELLAPYLDEEGNIDLDVFYTPGVVHAIQIIKKREFFIRFYAKFNDYPWRRKLLLCIHDVMEYRKLLMWYNKHGKPNWIKENFKLIWEKSYSFLWENATYNPKILGSKALDMYLKSFAVITNTILGYSLYLADLMTIDRRTSPEIVRDFIIGVRRFFSKITERTVNNVLDFDERAEAFEEMMKDEGGYGQPNFDVVAPWNNLTFTESFDIFFDRIVFWLFLSHRRLNIDPEIISKLLYVYQRQDWPYVTKEDLEQFIKERGIDLTYHAKTASKFSKGGGFFWKAPWKYNMHYKQVLDHVNYIPLIGYDMNHGQKVVCMMKWGRNKHNIKFSHFLELDEYLEIIQQDMFLISERERILVEASKFFEQKVFHPESYRTVIWLKNYSETIAEHGQKIMLEYPEYFRWYNIPAHEEMWANGMLWYDNLNDGLEKNLIWLSHKIVSSELYHVFGSFAKLYTLIVIFFLIDRFCFAYGKRIKFLRINEYRMFRLKLEEKVFFRWGYGILTYTTASSILFVIPGFFWGKDFYNSFVEKWRIMSIYKKHQNQHIDTDITYEVGQDFLVKSDKTRPEGSLGVLTNKQIKIYTILYDMKIDFDLFIFHMTEFFKKELPVLYAILTRALFDYLLKEHHYLTRIWYYFLTIPYRLLYFSETIIQDILVFLLIYVPKFILFSTSFFFQEFILNFWSNINMIFCKLYFIFLNFCSFLVLSGVSFFKRSCAIFYAWYELFLFYIFWAFKEFCFFVVSQYIWYVDKKLKFLLEFQDYMEEYRWSYQAIWWSFYYESRENLLPEYYSLPAWTERVKIILHTFRPESFREDFFLYLEMLYGTLIWQPIIVPLIAWKDYAVFLFGFWKEFLKDFDPEWFERHKWAIKRFLYFWYWHEEANIIWKYRKIKDSIKLTWWQYLSNSYDRIFGGFYDWQLKNIYSESVIIWYPIFWFAEISWRIEYHIEYFVHLIQYYSYYKKKKAFTWGRIKRHWEIMWIRKKEKIEYFWINLKEFFLFPFTAYKYYFIEVYTKYLSTLKYNVFIYTTELKFTYQYYYLKVYYFFYKYFCIFKESTRFFEHFEIKKNQDDFLMKDMKERIKVLDRKINESYPEFFAEPLTSKEISEIEKEKALLNEYLDLDKFIYKEKEYPLSKDEEILYNAGLYNTAERNLIIMEWEAPTKEEFCHLREIRMAALAAKVEYDSIKFPKYKPSVLWTFSDTFIEIRKPQIFFTITENIHSLCLKIAKIVLILPTGDWIFKIVYYTYKKMIYLNKKRKELKTFDEYLSIFFEYVFNIYDDICLYFKYLTIYFKYSYGISKELNILNFFIDHIIYWFFNVPKHLWKDIYKQDFVGDWYFYKFYGHFLKKLIYFYDKNYKDRSRVLFYIDEFKKKKSLYNTYSNLKFLNSENLKESYFFQKNKIFFNILLQEFKEDRLRYINNKIRYNHDKFYKKSIEKFLSPETSIHDILLKESLRNNPIIYDLYTKYEIIKETNSKDFSKDFEFFKYYTKQDIIEYYLLYIKYSFFFIGKVIFDIFLKLVDTVLMEIGNLIVFPIYNLFQYENYQYLYLEYCLFLSHLRLIFLEFKENFLKVHIFPKVFYFKEKILFFLDSYVLEFILYLLKLFLLWSNECFKKNLNLDVTNVNFREIEYKKYLENLLEFDFYLNLSIKILFFLDPRELENYLQLIVDIIKLFWTDIKNIILYITRYHSIVNWIKMQPKISNQKIFYFFKAIENNEYYNVQAKEEITEDRNVYYLVRNIEYLCNMNFKFFLSILKHGSTYCFVELFTDLLLKILIFLSVWYHRFRIILGFLIEEFIFFMETKFFNFEFWYDALIFIYLKTLFIFRYIYIIIIENIVYTLIGTFQTSIYFLISLYSLIIQFFGECILFLSRVLSFLIFDWFKLDLVIYILNLIPESILTFVNGIEFLYYKFSNYSFDTRIFFVNSFARFSKFWYNFSNGSYWTENLFLFYVYIKMEPLISWIKFNFRYVKDHYWVIGFRGDFKRHLPFFVGHKPENIPYVRRNYLWHSFEYIGWDYWFPSQNANYNTVYHYIIENLALINLSNLPAQFKAKAMKEYIHEVYLDSLVTIGMRGLKTSRKELDSFFLLTNIVYTIEENLCKIQKHKMIFDTPEYVDMMTLRYLKRFLIEQFAVNMELKKEWDTFLAEYKQEFDYPDTLNAEMVAYLEFAKKQLEGELGNLNHAEYQSQIYRLFNSFNLEGMEYYRKQNYLSSDHWNYKVNFDKMNKYFKYDDTMHTFRGYLTHPFLSKYPTLLLTRYFEWTGGYARNITYHKFWESYQMVKFWEYIFNKDFVVKWLRNRPLPKEKVTSIMNYVLQLKKAMDTYLFVDYNQRIYNFYLYFNGPAFAYIRYHFPGQSLRFRDSRFSYEERIAWLEQYIYSPLSSIFSNTSVVHRIKSRDLRHYLKNYDNWSKLNKFVGRYLINTKSHFFKKIRNFGHYKVSRDDDFVFHTHAMQRGLYLYEMYLQRCELLFNAVETRKDFIRYPVGMNKEYALRWDIPNKAYGALLGYKVPYKWFYRVKWPEPLKKFVNWEFWQETNFFINLNLYRTDETVHDYFQYLKHHNFFGFGTFWEYGLVLTSNRNTFRRPSKITDWENKKWESYYIRTMAQWREVYFEYGKKYFYPMRYPYTKFCDLLLNPVYFNARIRDRMYQRPRCYHYWVFYDKPEDVATTKTNNETDNFFNNYTFYDVPESGQYGFQDPASPIMEGIIDLHHDLVFFMILISIYVSWILFNVIYNFSVTNYPFKIFVKNRVVEEIVSYYESLQNRLMNIIDLFVRIASISKIFAKVLEKPISWLYDKAAYYKKEAFKHKESVSQMTMPSAWIYIDFHDNEFYNKIKDRVNEAAEKGEEFDLSGFNDAAKRILYLIFSTQWYRTKYNAAIQSTKEYEEQKEELFQEIALEIINPFHRLYTIQAPHSFNNEFEDRASLPKEKVFFPQLFVHNTNIEIIWTIIPAIILILIAIPSFSLLYAMDQVWNPMITVKVIGNQWYWSYEYC